MTLSDARRAVRDVNGRLSRHMRGCDGCLMAEYGAKPEDRCATGIILTVELANAESAVVRFMREAGKPDEPETMLW